MAILTVMCHGVNNKEALLRSLFIEFRVACFWVFLRSLCTKGLRQAHNDVFDPRRVGGTRCSVSPQRGE